MKMNYVMPLTQEVTFNGQNVMQDEILPILTVSTPGGNEEDAD